HVDERVQPDRQRIRCEERATLGEISTEGRDEQAPTRGRVEEREQSAEHGCDDQSAPEDVVGALPSRLAGRRAGEEHSQDRRRKEERNPGEGGGSGGDTRL